MPDAGQSDAGENRELQTRWGAQSGSRIPDRHASPDEVSSAAGYIPDHHQLDALCYNTGDRIVLTDDIPGNNTISCLVEAMTTAGGVTTFTVTEPLDWSFENPRALIRYQDGSASGLMVASRVGDYQLSVPNLSDFDDPLKIDQTSPAIEPVRLVFCGSTRHVYDAIVEEIAPQSDGTCQVTAKEYRTSFYDYDNASYPGDIA